MPYIKPSQRTGLDPFIEQFRVLDVGELNYVITRIIDNYIKANDKRYATLNAVIGVLECAKLELYRRVAAPYEDEKRDMNGDCYWC